MYWLDMLMLMVIIWPALFGQSLFVVLVGSWMGLKLDLNRV